MFYCSYIIFYGDRSSKNLEYDGEFMVHFPFVTYELFCKKYPKDTRLLLTKEI